MSTTVLIVEDEAITAMALENKLQRMAYQIVGVVDSGEAAVAAAREHLPNLILMDINLIGDMDGIEAAGQIRRFLQVPIIYLTAYSGNEFLGRAKLTEPFGYLIKPIESKTLHATIEMALFKNEMESELAKREQWLQNLMACMDDSVFALDDQREIRFINNAAQKLIGCDREMMVGKPFEEVLLPAQDKVRRTILEAVETVYQNGAIQRFGELLPFLNHKGQVRMITLSIAPIFDLRRQIHGLVITVQDFTREHALSQRISHLDRHDPLTDLINRKGFSQYLAKAVNRAKQSRCRHILISLDLDQFRVINDTCGHHAGDELLKRFAHLLLSSAEESSVVARIGGDEFALFLPDCDLEHGERMARHLLEIIESFSFEWNEQTYRVSASMGIIRIDAATVDAAQCMALVDEACYLAKAKGRNQIYVLKAGEQEVVEFHGRMQWVQKCNQALAEDRFRLYFQSIVPLADDHDEGEHGELLLRMVDPAGNIIPPNNFIPAAETFGIMPLLDRWVLQKAFHLIEQRLARQTDSRRNSYSINLSGLSLNDFEQLRFIQSLLDQASFDPSVICFEITETAAIANLAHTIAFITSLKERGCRFSLDDFGSGFSSFTYLKAMPVDYLKIDGSFVRYMDTDPADYSIVQAIINAAQALKKKTIAEFVESDAIHRCLKECGADYGQGYFFQKPVPFE